MIERATTSAAPAEDLTPPVEPDVEECVSAAAHISDVWCQAADCAPVFVKARLCKRE